jgi:hypothetical protein
MTSSSSKMAAPNTLTVSYISAYTNGIASAQATATVSIPAGIDCTRHVVNIRVAGGLWIANASGVNQFIPWNQITGITAQ